MIETIEQPVEILDAKSCANVAIRSVDDWESINWDYHTRIVRKLQLRIAKATQLKKFTKVKHLQWILVHSISAKLLAVRGIMENAGSKTPGVDGITIKSPKEKLALAKSLKRKNYKAAPLRRIYIPKAGNKKKLRPISIPTLYDRAQQFLYNQALLPVAEVTADINSFGFRQHRNCADAIAQCFIALATQRAPQYILDADISGCFDNISHDWMLQNICTDKVMLSQWLKAGYVDMKRLFPTEVGSAQGGIISPTLCNMVLDGLADMLKSTFKKQKGIHLIRYADDLIVTSYSKELLEQDIQPAIECFLKERGLELSKEKTKIVHIEEGFDFLGQNVRKYTDHGKMKLLIKPSEKNIHSFLKGIKTVFHKARSLNQSDLIQILNPKIRGWANYHRHVVSKYIFNKLDHLIWHQTLRWAKRRHPRKGYGWILKKYFKSIKGITHEFHCSERQEDGTLLEYTLAKMSAVPIRRHVKILGPVHPYDKGYDGYFEKRTSEKWRNNSKRRYVENIITMFQKDKCPICQQKLTINQRWCVSLKRKASMGGEYKSDNMDIVHIYCHKSGNKEKLHKRTRTVKPVTNGKCDFK